MFKRAADSDPNSALVHRNRGRVYNNRGFTDEAIKEFRRAIELDPNDAGVHNDLGVAYVEKGLWQDAIAEFERASQLDPNFDLARKNLESAQKEEVLKPPAEMPNPEAYHLLYAFENKLRLFIHNRMEKTVGKEWWKQRIPSDVQERCEERKRKRENYPWMEAKECHPIFYSDFLDLMKIMTLKDNWKQIFSQYFNNVAWTKTRLEELNVIRNDIAHNRELTPDDFQKLRIFRREVLRCLESRLD